MKIIGCVVLGSTKKQTTSTLAFSFKGHWYDFDDIWRIPEVYTKYLWYIRPTHIKSSFPVNCLIETNELPELRIWRVSFYLRRIFRYVVLEPSATAVFMMSKTNDSKQHRRSVIFMKVYPAWRNWITVGHWNFNGTIRGRKQCFVNGRFEPLYFWKPWHPNDLK